MRFTPPRAAIPRGRSRPALEDHLSYWKRRLSGPLPVLALPTDRLRRSVPTSRTARQPVQLPHPLAGQLRALGQREGVTLFVTLLAAFQVLLSRYSDQDDVLVGTSIPNRDRAGIEPSIDSRASIVLLRTDLSGDPSFRELLARVCEGVREAMAHDGLPFERLVEALEFDREPGPSLPQILFTLKEGPIPALEPDDLIPPAPDSAPQQVLSEPESVPQPCDLALSVVESAQELAGTLTYNAELFESATIARTAGHLRTLLEGIVARPEERLSALPILTQAERHQLLVEWNDTRADYPRDSCAHVLFEQQVDRAPEAVALVSGTRQLTYRELNRRSNQLAHRLRALGVGPDVLVGICVERSVDMVVGMLAILKAGGAYVPLDPSYPAERLVFMLADAQAPVLLGWQSLVARLGPVSAHIVCMDGDAAVDEGEPEENPESGVTAENLAYVMYTSGSTGKPKGVLIPHRGLVNYLWWATRAYGVAEGSGAPVHTSLGFDLTITSLFPPLLAGRAVLLLPEEEGLGALAASLRDGNDLNPVKITPAHLSLLNLQLPPEQAAGRARVLVIGGEALSWESLEFWRRHAPATRLINEYGPTETVVGCCVYEATGESGRSGAVPIGRPIANTQLYVLDRHRQPVPVGVPGELHIGGDDVARGYLNRPELTAASFVPDPFSGIPGARMYKTGDLARYLPDGNLEFLGRVDHQVKLRGFRVELGEIEAALDQHPAVRQSVVVVREDAPGNPRLVAYVAPERDPAPPAGELRHFLNEKLPDFMVPSAILLLNALPLTLNGKIDRQALPAPDPTRPELGNAFAPPRDGLEQQLAGIWEEALRFRPVGVRDDFFDLGGDSLLAAHVILEIEKVLGKRLALGTLFQAPTVEQLADVLQQQGGPALPPHIVAIRDTGSTPPFFCIPGLGGNILSLRHLARHLDPRQVIYGLEAAGIYGERPPGQAGVEKVAAEYIKEIQTIQPEGPYFLGGFSFGGTVVFEMAQQLCAQGQKVALLALFDSYGPGYLYFGPRALLQKVRHHMGVLQNLRRGERLPYLMDRAGAVRREIRNVLTGIVDQIPIGRDSRPLDRHRPDPPYEPTVYPGRVTLFRTEKQPPECSRDPQMGWGRVAAGGLEIREIPGDHFTVMEVHARLLAEQLTACLPKAVG